MWREPELIEPFGVFIPHILPFTTYRVESFLIQEVSGVRIVPEVLEYPVRVELLCGPSLTPHSLKYTDIPEDFKVLI